MNEDPRLILTSRRPGGLDDREPEVAAVLATLADDPALAEWAKNETATDQKITDALRTVQPPLGLRERILTGARASRPTAIAGGGSWFERRAFGILRYSELVALAAVLTLLGIALAYNYFGQTADDRPWQVFAVAKAAEIESGTTDIDHQDSFLASTAGWLTEHACPAPSSLPKGLGKLPLFGCSAMKWNGKPMGIVCFSIGDKKEIHLVSIDARNIPDTLGAEPRWTEVSGYTSAQWVQDGTAYMLIGRLPRATLEPLLAQKIASVFTASFASYL